MKLLVVESPTKTKKLSQFLGDGYRIAASYGHVADLPAKGGIAVTFKDGHVVPTYLPLERSGRALSELKSLAARADEILLATDPDREGEAIAWHVARLLATDKPIRRVTFNAVTKAAVVKAVAAPRDLDEHLVGAQQARRVLDRVVGWIVSPTLRQGLGDRNARSAGRVQSVALRLVAEREQEIAAFKVVRYFSLTARVRHAEKPPPFACKLVEWKGDPLEHRLAEAALAERTAAWCRKQDWTVESVSRREQKRRPPPPFVTATVQQAASVRLKLEPKRCMQLLQQLFENGHITYHRTDSVAVEPEAIAAARAIITERFAPTYLPAEPVVHVGKVANAQEAHEAIRPTHPESGPDGVGADEPGRLYRLIWERFIASQMADARDHLTVIRVAIGLGGFAHPVRGAVPVGVCEAKGKVVLFDGWRALTEDTTEERKAKGKKKGVQSGDDDEEDESAELPPVEAGEALVLEDLATTEHQTKPPARFTQASLIKKLESAGVGRPSTYAAIISTILERGYVEDLRRRLHATALGLRVTDYLKQHFSGNFIDVAFTAAMEEQLDAIARGEAGWEAVTTEAAFTVRDLARRAGLEWDPLDPDSQPPDPAAPHPDAPPCPLCGGGMAKRHSRFGPFFACLDRACPAICDLEGKPNRKTRDRLEKPREPEGPASG